MANNQRLQVNLTLTVPNQVAELQQGPNNTILSTEERVGIIEDAVNAMIQVLDAATSGNVDRPSPALAGVRGRPY